MASHLRACLVWFVFLAIVNSKPASATSLTVQQHLKRLNKPAISTIESPDGDMIDCIAIAQQPAFDHPLLRNHTIQMKPEFMVTNPFIRKEDVDGTLQEAEKHNKFVTSSNGSRIRMAQLWHQIGASCPEGTIPVRRTTEQDLLRTKTRTMDMYGRKFHSPARPSAVSAASVDESGHQHAITYVQGGRYYGAKATMNVWNPSVDVSNEFSLSQIWILGGSFKSNLNSIEAGWQVSPDLYGDNNTRLFIYWTSDAYQTTGCYNLLCSGFVQVSNAIAMGATIAPVSSYGNHQYDITILLWKDPKQGNWWMQFGNRYILGYWPAALFSSLATSATMVEWGGEVVNSEPGGQHTTTQMGSGHFPSEGFGKSAYFSHLLIVDSNNDLMAPGNVNTFTEYSSCYDVQSSSSSDWGIYFYYGGPGRNANCP